MSKRKKIPTGGRMLISDVGLAGPARSARAIGWRVDLSSTMSGIHLSRRGTLCLPVPGQVVQRNEDASPQTGLSAKLASAAASRCWLPAAALGWRTALATPIAKSWTIWTVFGYRLRVLTIPCAASG